MAKDMSRVYFNLNGFSLKNIREIAWNKPTDPWTQDDEDLYGEHENILANSSKIVFTITIRPGTDDERTLKTMEISKIEGAGAFIDKRTGIAQNIAFDKAVVSNNDKNYTRTENTVQYIVKASVIGDVII